MKEPMKPSRLNAKSQKERNPYTVVDNYANRSNFICETILPIGPRVLAVDKNGAKKSLYTEEEVLQAKFDNIEPTSATNGFYDVSSTPSLQTVVKPSKSSTSITTSSTTIHLPTINKLANDEHLNMPNIKKPKMQSINTKNIPMKSRTGTSRKSSTTVTSYIESEMTTQVSEMTTKASEMNAETTVIFKGKTPKSDKFMKPVIRGSAGDMVHYEKPPRRLPTPILPLKRRNNNDLVKEFKITAAIVWSFTIISLLFYYLIDFDNFIGLLTNLLKAIEDWHYRRQQPLSRWRRILRYFDIV